MEIRNRHAESLSSDKSSIGVLLANITTVVSLVATIVYLTWFAASVDKRVSLLEQHDVTAQDQFVDMRNSLTQASNNQDQSLHELRNSFDDKLARLDDKMDKVLFILSTKSNAYRGASER